MSSRSANGRRNGRRERVTLVTGGAGFVGTNLAHRLLEEGRRVVVLDNLSRAGVERNLRWLRETHPASLEVEIGDVRDALCLRRALARADEVFHLASQVAVTTSLLEPLEDFAVNLEATVKLLEEIRRLPHPPRLVFTSTNKVYGGLSDLDLVRTADRWEPFDPLVRAHGIDERRPLEFRTPYGCSKGGAEQYVVEYAKSYGIPAVVFRMSCIYGPHQHGTEDQGWVAHFVLRALGGEPITIYGDGAQVRDVLYVDDLVDAMMLALEGADDLAGAAFNVGGGPENAVSLLELVDLIGATHGERPELVFAGERPGDQRYYVSDTRRFASATGWRPSTPVQKGVEALYGWLAALKRPGAPAAARVEATAR